MAGPDGLSLPDLSVLEGGVSPDNRFKKYLTSDQPTPAAPAVAGISPDNRFAKYLQPLPKAEDGTSIFGEAMKGVRAIPGFLNTQLGQAEAITGQLTGNEGLRQAGEERYKAAGEGMEKPAVGSLADVGSVADVGKFAAYGTTSNLLPSMGETGVGAAVGGALGMLGGPFAEATVPLGMAGGALASSYLQNLGQNYQDYRTQGAEPGTALEAGGAVAVPQAALDVLTPLRAGRVVSPVLDKALSPILRRGVERTVQRAEKSSLGRAAKEGLTEAGMEAGTEGAQQALEAIGGTAATGQPLMTRQNAIAIADAAALGGVGGGITGTVAGALSPAPAAAEPAGQGQGAPPPPRFDLGGPPPVPPPSTAPRTGQRVTATVGGQPKSGTVELSETIDGEPWLRVKFDDGGIADDALGAFKDLTIGEGTREKPKVIETPEQAAEIGGRTEAEPTDGQKEAENYRSEHVNYAGFPVTIETEQGGVRRSLENAPHPWEVPDFPAHYGRIKGTVGADGAHLDAFLGPNPQSPHAFVMNQDDLKGGFDEHKLFLGFDSPDQVLGVIDRAYSDGKARERIRSLHQVAVPALKAWIAEGNTKGEFAGGTNIDVRGVQTPTAPVVEQMPISTATPTPEPLTGQTPILTEPPKEAPAAAPIEDKTNTNVPPLAEPIGTPGEKISAPAGENSTISEGDLVNVHYEDGTVASGVLTKDLGDRWQIDFEDGRTLRPKKTLVTLSPRQGSDFAKSVPEIAPTEPAAQPEEGAFSLEGPTPAPTAEAAPEPAAPATEEDFDKGLRRIATLTQGAEDHIVAAIKNGASNLDLAKAAAKHGWGAAGGATLNPGFVDGRGTKVTIKIGDETRTYSGGRLGKELRRLFAPAESEGQPPSAPSAETPAEVPSTATPPEIPAAPKQTATESEATPGTPNESQPEEQTPNEPQPKAEPESTPPEVAAEAPTPESPPAAREETAPVESALEEPPAAPEQQPEEAAAAAPEEAPPEEKPAAEPETGAFDLEKPTPEKPKKEPKPPAEPKKEKLTDTGERMEGKRAHLFEDLQKERTGETQKDLKRLQDQASLPKIFKISTEASAGAAMMIEEIRDALPSWGVWAGKKYGGRLGGKKYSWTKSPLEAIAAKLESAPDQVLKDAAEYIEVARQFAEALQHEVSVTRVANEVAATLYGNGEVVLTRAWGSEGKDGYGFGIRKVGTENASSYGLELTEFGKRFGEVFEIFPIAQALKGRPWEDSMERPTETTPLVRPRYKVEDITRAGGEDYREGRDVTPEEFIFTFGFRGVEFGNWVTGKERQAHINAAYDAFRDLAARTGFPVKGISLGGKLGLAFGSRGKGRHAAHYEPDTNVINLTRTSGDGSVSHEWMHALDAALSGSSKVYVDQVKALLRATYDEEAILSTLDSILTGSTYAQGQKRIGPMENARNFVRSHWRHWNKKVTRFAKEADQLGADYWGNPFELWARSAEAWHYDEFLAKEQSTPYLVTDWVADGHVNKEKGYKGRPYPTGEERAAFARLWRQLFDDIQWDDKFAPSIKAEAVPPRKALLDRIQEKLNAIDLAVRQEQAINGPAGKDGLWWYALKKGERAVGNQPKGYAAYADNHQRYEGRGGGVNYIGYSRPLAAEEVVNFGLARQKGWSPENAIYLRTEGGEDVVQDRPEPNEPDELGPDGGAALEAAPPEDGRLPPGPGRPGGGADERTGEGEGGVRGPREPGDRSRERTGDHAPPLDPAAVGTGATDLGSGQDAVQPTGTDYRITLADRIGKGSITEKFDANLEAIRTLKTVEAEGRLATPEEQAKLVKYVGWGGMPQAFQYFSNYGHDTDMARVWQPRQDALKELIGEDDYYEARRSTINAHYTAANVVEAMWRAVEKLGFKGGRVLEPAVGSGNFFGLMPESLIGAVQRTGVDLDSLTARIAKQLYQRATILHSGFQDIKFPENFFDLTISNVPFSAEDKPVDAKYNKARLGLHDYFIVKSLALTRPGGLVAVISTKGTLDKFGEKARAQIAQAGGDLIAAIRLPQNAFKENANTVVTTDILLFRKTGQGIPLLGQAWGQVGQVSMPIENSDEKGQGDLNEYFVAHPENMLGEMVLRRGRYGNALEAALKGDPEGLQKGLDDAVDRLPANLIITQERSAELAVLANAIPAEGEARDGGFYNKDGKLFVRRGDLMVPHEATGKKAERIIAQLGVRDAARAVLRKQLDAAPEAETEAARKALNKSYDAFVKKYGYLSEKENAAPFSDDPDSAFLLALEFWSPETGKAKKADIFSINTTPPSRLPEQAGTGEQALLISLNGTGRVDLPLMAKLTGRSRDELLAELQGAIYDDPQQGWVTADDYLSGNVREKLAIAESAVKLDPKYQANVAALKKVQPEDLAPSQITARLGAPWIGAPVVRAFAAELLNRPKDAIELRHVKETGQWIARRSADKRWDALKFATETTVTWGTERRDFFDILQATLNGQRLVVKDKIDEKTYVLNVEATEAANAKAQLIKDKFARWIWQSPFADKLHRKYNDDFNNIRLRSYTYPTLGADEKGGISLPGMSALLKLRPHQANGVWRILMSGNTYLGHEVGTGKTFTMVAAAMEGKRLGIYKKPMIAVLKSTLEGFKAEFLRLYPGANVLSTPISKVAAIRKQQLARIATNNWDAVIVTHDSLNALPDGESEINAAFKDELQMLEQAILGAVEGGEPPKGRLVKNLEKAKIALANRLKKRLSQVKKDAGMTFQDLGVDQLMIDEAQEYKNLEFQSRMGRQIKGLQPDGSGQAFDLGIKSRYLNSRYGRGLVLASGTPISNSVGELYTISRYLQPSELTKHGLQHFDMWAQTFGDMGTVAEYAPEGGGYRMVSKFNRFVNLPELLQMTYSVMDVVSAEKANISRPEIENGKPEAITVPQNPLVKKHQVEIGRRAIAIRTDPKGSDPDNMLVVVGDGRKGAIDMRLVDPKLPDQKETKVNAAVGRIYDLWKETAKFKGTQLVFIDFGAPDVKGVRFSPYQDLKDKLVEKGIPKDEIAFIHDAKDDRQRAALFARVRSGAVRVFVGSTKKAGTGVNVQDRVAAIHHLDIHWNLANYRQRNGRGWRQGNLIGTLDPGRKLKIFNYVTEGTVDAFMWDKNASKGLFIDQIMSGDMTIRVAEDVSQDTMSASEMVAVTSGDPRIAKKVQLESDQRKYAALVAAESDTKHKLRSQINFAPERIGRAEAEVRDLTKTLDKLPATDGLQVKFTSVKDAPVMSADKEATKLGDALRKIVEQWAPKLSELTSVQGQIAYLHSLPSVIFAHLLDKEGKLISFLNIGTYSSSHSAPAVGLYSLPGTPKFQIKDDTTLNKGIEGIRTAYANAIAHQQATIAEIKAELPKWKEELAKPSEAEGKLRAVETELTQITSELLIQQQKDTDQMAAAAGIDEEGDSGEGDKSRGARVPGKIGFITTGDRVEAVKPFRAEIEIPGLEGHTFFTRHVGAQWVVTHTASGVEAARADTEAKALERLRGRAYINPAALQQDFDNLTPIAEEDKASALQAAGWAPKAGDFDLMAAPEGWNDAPGGREGQLLPKEIMDRAEAAWRTLKLPADRLGFAKRLSVGPAGAEMARASSGKDTANVQGATIGPYLVLVSLDAVEEPETIAWHEGFHFLENNGAFTDEELAMMDRERASLLRAVAHAKHWKLNDPRLANISNKEVRAYAFQDYMRARTDLGIDQPGFKPMIARAFYRLWRMILSVRKAAKGLGFKTVDDLYNSVATGERGAAMDVAPLPKGSENAVREPGTINAPQLKIDTADFMAAPEMRETVKRDFGKMLELFKGVGPAENVAIERPQTAKDAPVGAAKVMTPEAFFRHFEPRMSPVQAKAAQNLRNQQKWIGEYKEKAGKITEPLSKQQLARTGELMFAGDAAAREFTRAEVETGSWTDVEGTHPILDGETNDPEIAGAYLELRKLMHQIGRQVDLHERAMLPFYRREKKRLISSLARALRRTDEEFRADYTALEDLWSKYRRADYATGTGENPEALSAEIDRREEELIGRFRDPDGNLSAEGEEFQSDLQSLKSVEAKLQATSIQRRVGYFPHKFIGSWGVYRVETAEDGSENYALVADPKNGFYTDVDAATRAANAVAIAEPEARLLVRPVEFKFPNSEATELSDAAYQRFLANIQSNYSLELDESRELAQGVARRRFRRRMPGFKQYRTGVEGFSKDFGRVLDAHIGETMRYIAADSNKALIVNAQERLGYSPRRSASQQRPQIAKMIEAWFRDINGQKSPSETWVDELFDKPWMTPLTSATGAALVTFLGTGGLTGNPLVGALVSSYVGYRFYQGVKNGGEFKSRAITGALLNDMAHLKLGMVLNIFSPIVNLTQTVINTYPVLGLAYTAKGSKRFIEARLAEARGNVTPDAKLMHRAGVVTKYSASEINPHLFSAQSKLAAASMYFFTKAEAFNRGTAFMGALAKAEDEGLSPGAAQRYAENVMNRTQFDYSAVNKPELLRNVFIRVPGQFKNFLAQQLAFIFGLNRTELPRFLFALFLVGGAIGLPFLDLIDKLMDGLFDISPLAMIKEFMLEQVAAGGIRGDLATFFARGLPAVFGVDLSSRAGMENFLPLTMRDLGGPWWGTLSNARDLGAQNATFIDQLRNLSGGVGAPLKVLQALQTGVLTSPWLGGKVEYKPDAFQLALKAIGGTPTEESQRRDLNTIERRKIENYKAASSHTLNQVVAASRAGDTARVRALLLEAAKSGHPVNPGSIKRALRMAGMDRLERLIHQSPRQLRPEIIRLYQGLIDDNGGQPGASEE